WSSATETTKLTPSDAAAGDYFGSGVAAASDTIVAGATGAKVNGQQSGAAYVFRKPADGWTRVTESAKLIPSDGHGGDDFGWVSALVGDTVVVGAGYASGPVARQGAVYVFGLPSDASAPTIDITDPPDGAKYTLNQSATARYRCADEAGGSGL